MTLPTILDLCEPRPDVRAGTIRESDFAADLAQVLRGDAPPDYADPIRFFANTHPTRGLRTLLHQVLSRLGGTGEAVSSIFRLDTQFGGGKTHALIALCHAARGATHVPEIHEFVSPSLLPTSPVRIGAFDGENADPMNGRTLPNGLRAFTPWGELAYALAGREGFERVRPSDEARISPGADTLRELFGGQPTLILLDELAIYLRKVSGLPGAGEQLTAFLTSLFKAVEGTPNACVVFTLAVGRDGKAGDAYASENLFVSERLAETESVAARKATVLAPTAEDETVAVLQRRLFQRIDVAGAQAVVTAYAGEWQKHRDSISQPRLGEDRSAEFLASYPLHPALISVLTGRLSTLSTFHRVRGMLRLLAQTVSRLWSSPPAATYAIHPHHIDIGYERIRYELLTRLGLQSFAPAVSSDVAPTEAGRPSLAQELDAKHYSSLPPYGTLVGRTVLLHTFAFNEELKGCSPDELRWSVLAPGLDIAFIEDARKRFITESAYLDDRPNAPMRFLSEANLTQIVRRQEQTVDDGEVRSLLNDRVRELFKGSVFELIPHPATPSDLPDDIGNGRPYLALLHHDAVLVHAERIVIPPLVERLYRHKSDGTADFRRLSNNVCFLVADAQGRVNMDRLMRRRLALEALRRPSDKGRLASHQSEQLDRWYQVSETELTVAIQQTYRHVFFPSRQSVDGSSVSLAHAVIDKWGASGSPGQGQLQVVRLLRDSRKLRTSEDSPDSPTYIRDRTPLRRGQISTNALRDEFRRDVSLPILVGSDVFIAGIQLGIDQGEYVYQRGSLTVGKGDPRATIQIDEQSTIFTAEFARVNAIWPRQAGQIDSGKPQASTVAQQVSPGVTGVDVGIRRTPAPPPSTPGSPSTDRVRPELRVEAPLASALARLWRLARDQNLTRLASVKVKVFDRADVFKMVGAIGTLVGPKRHIVLEGSYETTSGATLEVLFNGGFDDAKPVREFLEPQIRAAKDAQLEGEFLLQFPNGLSLSDDSAEKLSDKLTRFVSGAAFVEAEAEAAPAESTRSESVEQT